MNYIEAQSILDQRRAGADMPEQVITKALELTGDVEPEYTPADAMRELLQAA
jgi:hypothetical protein